MAAADNGVIGNANRLPWHIPEDLKRFKQLTSGHAVVMGRKTFESIGKPLPNRKNIVISRTMLAGEANGRIAVGSLEEALLAAQGSGEIFVIGGDSIYRQAMPLAQRLYVTHVHVDAEGDTFFPEISGEVWEQVANSGAMACGKSELRYSFATYARRSRESIPA
ncbi:MAG: dihydrofolate reductase [Prevotellaceae bacterium]|nr:dihydrofolate reductase [Prevotellaceae bacterium]